jgi:hypothetical protein
MQKLATSNSTNSVVRIDPPQLRRDRLGFRMSRIPRIHNGRVERRICEDFIHGFGVP